VSMKIPLGLTLALPAEWQFFEKDQQREMGLHPTEPGSNPDCLGPLCHPTIDVALISRQGTPPVGSIFISGYRLPSQYQDRQRYPLEKFAEAMMKGSMGASGWMPIGDMTAITLGSQHAYRMLAHKLTLGYDMKGLGYVAESNGYVFLMVATAAPSASAAQLLQSAIENMSLSPPKR
jgi:hypothetical protein